MTIFNPYILSCRGLILVRPEVYFYRETYRKFLEERDLEVVFEKKVRLDFKEYLGDQVKSFGHIK